jgi:hypothetical protein
METLMSSRLGDHIRSTRRRLNLSLGQVARLVGYRNLSKGSRRIAAIENSGRGDAVLLGEVLVALGIHPATAADLAEQDRQERRRVWDEWADQPVPMRMIVRIMAAMYSEQALPAGVETPEQAETYARNFAKAHRLKVCLALSRRLSVWIDESGEVIARTEAKPDEDNEPWMEIGGKRFLLNSVV